MTRTQRTPRAVQKWAYRRTSERRSGLAEVVAKTLRGEEIETAISCRTAYLKEVGDVASRKCIMLVYENGTRSASLQALGPMKLVKSGRTGFECTMDPHHETSHSCNGRAKGQWRRSFPDCHVKPMHLVILSPRVQRVFSSVDAGCCQSRQTTFLRRWQGALLRIMSWRG